MTHSEIWRALDVLAAEHGMSPSALARRAGLDPTTFNRSKRQTPDGRPRWPSTESLAKALDATGVTLEMFSHLIAGGRAFVTGASRMRRMPIIDIAQAGESGHFDEAGFPVGTGWDEVGAPEIADPLAYALEISNESMRPVFRHGDVVIVSPRTTIGTGDRVIVRTTVGGTAAKQFVTRSDQGVKFRDLSNEQSEITFAENELSWIHKIIWASQ